VTLGNGIRLHPTMARQLGCDATVQLAHTGEDGALNLGRTVRTFTRNQRRALARRHPVCGFPGCDVPAPRCQFHHVVPWEDGGTTDLDNGVPQCRHHHRAVHQGGWRLFKDSTGCIVVVAPDGRRLRGQPPILTVPDPSRPLHELHQAMGVEVTPVEPALERGSLAFTLDIVVGNASIPGRQYWDRRRERDFSLN
jgi:hypothetical protein